MIKKILLGQIRHFLSIGGSSFYGYMIAMGAEPTDITAIASGITALVSAIWSILDKIIEERKNDVKT